MVKHIPRLSRELDLIDELSCQQLSNDRFDPQHSQQVKAKPRPDHRRRTQRAFCFRVEPIDACGDRCLQCGRHITSVASATEMYAPRCPHSTPRPASSRTISSAKNGLPAAERRSSCSPVTVGAARAARRRVDRLQSLSHAGNGLSTGQPRQRSLVLRSVGKQDHRMFCLITVRQRRTSNR